MANVDGGSGLRGVHVRSDFDASVHGHACCPLAVLCFGRTHLRKGEVVVGRPAPRATESTRDSPSSAQKFDLIYVRGTESAARHAPVREMLRWADHRDTGARVNDQEPVREHAWPRSPTYPGRSEWQAILSYGW